MQPLCRFRVRQPRPPAAMYTKLKPINNLFIFAGLHSLLGFANPEMRVQSKKPQGILLT
nr:MAG TPA: hypothetical protein [Caudoviricetes sp.]